MILSIFALGSLLFSTQGQGPGQQLLIPPVEAWSNSVNSVRLSTPTDGSLRASVRIRTDVKEVVVAWRYLPNFPDYTGKVMHNQEFEPRYWPTFACGVGSDTIVVAGQDGVGKTIIERWTFDASQAVALPTGITPAPRTSVTTHVSENVAGRRVVLQMRGSLANPNKLLVWYHDSRDVYELDLTTNSLAQVAGPGPTEPPGVLVEPALQLGYQALDARDNIQYGYVYIFTPRQIASPTSSVLVLMDGNRDGLLDGSLTLDEAGWGAGGWSDSASYQ